MKNKLLLLLFLLICFLKVDAQQFYRIKADFSSKEKLSNGSYRLTVGQVYYDKIYQKWVYKIRFPEVQTIVIQDTIQYIIGKDGLIQNQQKFFGLNEFSIFHLSLSNKLSDFGMSVGKTKDIYTISKIEKEADGRILTTWDVKEKKLLKYLGRIEMANDHKKLDAIAFYDNKGKLLSNRFFKDYVNIKGVEFPQQDTQISYNSNNTKTIQVTSYKNIIIDQDDEDDIYRYRIPITKSINTKKQSATGSKPKGN
jgi:hypothetical protein